MINIHRLRNSFADQLHFTKVANRAKGFTLTELLVTIVIGGIIVSSITALLTDVVRANQQEKVRTATQQDMERALEFIESDLKNATYIYTGDELRNKRGDLKSVASHLDVNQDYQIVLAFWKPETIPYSPAGAKIPLQCDNGSGELNSSLNSTDTTLEECTDLQVERRTYTLVAYLQDTSPSDTWSGQSTILRYELRKYENDDVYTSSGEEYLTLNVSEDSSGNNIYVDPVKQADGFRNWPYDSEDVDLQSSKPTINGNTSRVLVDFVDDPSNDTGNLPTCLDESGGTDMNGNGTVDVYSRTPAVNQSKSFFACVRESTLDGDVSEGNQDVILYLRGNPDGRSGYEIKTSDSYTPLPTLSTQVLVRGVVDKYFDN